MIIIFDLGFDKFIIHARFYEGDVTIFVDGVQNTNSYALDFYAHYGKLNKRILYNKAGKLLTKVKSHAVYIKDIYVSNQNNSNGKIFLFELLKCIVKINKIYPINKIYGFLSPFDFDKWRKLIYFYSNLENHTSEYIDFPIALHFQLRDYELSKFLSKIECYKNEKIYFDIFINYN